MISDYFFCEARIWPWPQGSVGPIFQCKNRNNCPFRQWGSIKMVSLNGAIFPYQSWTEICWGQWNVQLHRIQGSAHMHSLCSGIQSTILWEANEVLNLCRKKNFALKKPLPKVHETRGGSCLLKFVGRKIEQKYNCYFENGAKKFSTVSPKKVSGILSFPFPSGSAYSRMWAFTFFFSRHWDIEGGYILLEYHLASLHHYSTSHGIYSASLDIIRRRFVTVVNPTSRILLDVRLIAQVSNRTVRAFLCFSGSEYPFFDVPQLAAKGLK